jgi:hypothetical protein
MASVAEIKKSFFAEIDKVENREDLEKLRVRYWAARRGFSRQFCVRRAHRSIVRWSAMEEMTSVPPDDASDLNA